MYEQYPATKLHIRRRQNCNNRRWNTFSHHPTSTSSYRNTCNSFSNHFAGSTHRNPCNANPACCWQHLYQWSITRELAFIRNDNLWIISNGVVTKLTNDATLNPNNLPELWYSDPRISPDGTKIAYQKSVISSGGNDTIALMLYDINGKNIIQLTSDIDLGFPVEWSNDNQKIFYPVLKWICLNYGSRLL